ncbi:MAG TPA: hypothetical protein VFE54_13870 [Mucilaginibacter sp.]|jgi:hypothetical protein|nr:hypothetical protein [Mucilaginibacter sp.]
MNKTIRRAAFIIAATIACVLANHGLAQRPATQSNSLLYWAQKLQQNVNPQNTAYQHKDNMVSWGDDGNPLHCYTDCSGFVNALMAKTFNWKESDFKAEWGHKRMFAYHYYDAIVSGNHFRQIKSIRDILPGDLIALQYADRSEHEDNTGHVMLIVSSPRSHRPSKLIEPNTLQYEVEVIDCSKSPHGKNDTRFNPDGTEYSGLGKGTFRLYTGGQGNITGYSWSIGNPKAGFDPFENPIAIGRFISQNYN